MKQINLRKYYPFYIEDEMIEVPDEIAEPLKELARTEDAYRIRTYRHKAIFSLDLMNEIREFPSDGPLPEEIVEQRSMQKLLYKGLQALPEKQRSRLVAYYFLGMTQAEIARAEGCYPYAIRFSIKQGLEGLKKFFEKI